MRPSRFIRRSPQKHSPHVRKHSPVEQVPMPADEPQQFRSNDELRQELEMALEDIQAYQETVEGLHEDLAQALRARESLHARHDALLKRHESLLTTQRLQHKNKSEAGKLESTHRKATEQLSAESKESESLQKKYDSLRLKHKSATAEEKSLVARIVRLENENTALAARVAQLETHQQVSTKPQPPPSPVRRPLSASAQRPQLGKKVVLDANPTMSQPLTYVSDLSSSSVYSALRKQIEDERHTRRGSAPTAAEQNTKTEASHQLGKETAINLDQNAEYTSTSNTSRRRRQAAAEENKALGFGLHDFTLDGMPAPEAERTHDEKRPAHPQRESTREATDVLERFGNHEAGACEMCSRFGIGKAERQRIAVHKNDEPTMRPSRDPAEQLHLVMKSLKNERYHIAQKALIYQHQLNRYDPTSGKKRREVLCEKIEKWNAELKRLDTNIYRLQDVVEAGMDLSHEIVDATLASLVEGGRVAFDEDEEEF